MSMPRASGSPVIHLELHTGDLAGAVAFYAALCGWAREPIQTSWGSYLALELGPSLGGGVVQCQTERPLWLPYVEVPEIVQATRRACRHGASVLLEPREGPSGWRSVIASSAGGELALWQQKR